MSRLVSVSQLVGLVPHLPRPVVLLESGGERDGVGGTRARLAWGARRRYRLDWSRESQGDLGWLRRVATGSGRVYGVIGYDLGLPPKAVRREPLLPQPLAEWFVPQHEVVLDVERGVVEEGELPEITGSRDRGAAVPSDSPAVRRFHGASSLLSRSFSQQAFEAAVHRVKGYIAAGDVYQVNLALAECFRVARSPWDCYLALRALNPSPWMGFADFGDWQLVSGSPELLVEVRRFGSSIVRARPIAGTRKKTGDTARDAVMRSELSLDAKEQAEHRMLLDLARNDLGRVCEFGTVAVSEREAIEEYSHVFHLVSEVRGVLRRDRDVADVVSALFPGGTITGAPKIRAMEVIAELEPVARGMYTGALGWMDGEALQLNILIRSAIVRDGVACVQAGAGIVWDSDPGREWRESLRKGAAMREALGVRQVLTAGAGR